MNESMGVRVAYRNAKDALAVELPWDESFAIQKFVHDIENRFSHLDVRIGNEIILDNHSTGASLGDALDSLSTEQPNSRHPSSGEIVYQRWENPDGD